MKKFNFLGSNILMSIVEVIIGVLLLIDPIGFTSGIISAFGVVIAVFGVIKIIGYFREDAEEASIDGKLSKGLLMLVLGLFCAFKSQWFIATFPVITVLYGVMILVTGVGKLQKAVDMLRLDMKYWFVALIGAVLTLAFALLILINPFASSAILWSFIGVALIVEAVMDILTFAFAKKN